MLSIARIMKIASNGIIWNMSHNTYSGVSDGSRNPIYDALPFNYTINTRCRENPLVSADREAEPPGI